MLFAEIHILLWTNHMTYCIDGLLMFKVCLCSWTTPISYPPLCNICPHTAALVLHTSRVLLVTSQTQPLIMVEWPSSPAAVIFHRGQQLRMWSMWSPKHVFLFPATPINFCKYFLALFTLQHLHYCCFKYCHHSACPYSVFFCSSTLFKLPPFVALWAGSVNTSIMMLVSVSKSSNHRRDMWKIGELF